MASKSFQTLQLGRESTQGTNVAATIKWAGPGATFRDARKMELPMEDVGIVGGTDRSIMPSVLAEFDTNETEVTFEQFPNILEASFVAATPSADGVGSGKIYNYPLFDTAEPDYTTLKSYSAEFGDSIQYEEASFCLCSEWELKGKSESAWKMTSKWFGREVANTTKTAGVAASTVSSALFQKTKMYIDAVSGSFATTQISATLLEANIKCVTGWYPIYTGDGNLYWTLPGFDSDKYSIQIDLTLLMNSSAVAQRDAWRLETPKLLSLKTEGAAVATPGTTYTYKTLLQNYAGKWQSFDPISTQNGTSIVKASFINRYNATKADRGNIIVVNELASLP